MIVLSTLNSTYQHCAFGLRYLRANLRELRSQCKLVEFTIAYHPRDVVEAILAENPKIVGLGVYIWNTHLTEEVVSCLKAVRPDLLIVLGGPEVSYEQQGQRLCDLADYIVCGEGEEVFYQLCKKALSGNSLPQEKILPGGLPPLESLKLPYTDYTDEDIQNRIIYVEASRGCPYKCEFCLSSLDTKVRHFNLDTFLDEMDQLIARGARQFKFVDRTFNLAISSCTRILQFFLGRMHHELFLHFEMIPDRLPEELKVLIRQFPEGSLQFEIGIQTLNPEVATLISRRQDFQKVRENFAFLSNETRVHMHADLIVGLPGETLESFAKGFDELSALGPHEIQVGLLKRLKGTPITRHDGPYSMRYQHTSPFTILETKDMPFATIQSLVRFAKFWDLYANSGNFHETMGLLKERSEQREVPSLFWEFHEFSEFLSARHPHRHSLALMTLVESAWLYLTEVRKADPNLVREILIDDYTSHIKRDVPPFLRASPAQVVHAKSKRTKGATPARQQKHLIGSDRGAKTSVSFGV